MSLPSPFRPRRPRHRRGSAPTGRRGSASSQQSDRPDFLPDKSRSFLPPRPAPPLCAPLCPTGTETSFTHGSETLACVHVSPPRKQCLPRLGRRCRRPATGESLCTAAPTPPRPSPLVIEGDKLPVGRHDWSSRAGLRHEVRCWAIACISTAPPPRTAAATTGEPPPRHGTARPPRAGRREAAVMATPLHMTRPEPCTPRAPSLSPVRRSYSRRTPLRRLRRGLRVTAGAGAGSG